MLSKVVIHYLEKGISSDVMILMNDTSSFKMAGLKANSNGLWKTVTTQK